jgi:hypothetical protein
MSETPNPTDRQAREGALPEYSLAAIAAQRRRVAGAFANRPSPATPPAFDDVCDQAYAVDVIQRAEQWFLEAHRTDVLNFASALIGAEAISAARNALAGNQPAESEA